MSNKKTLLLKMEPIHIFYKQLPMDEDSIFAADITEKNQVENVKFKKSLEYVVTGLSINQDIVLALVSVTDTDRQNSLRNNIQKLVKEKKTLILILKYPIQKKKM